MDILIFILVIVVLIVVHEFGHFVVAKLSGMRVDEFGLGYPPRAMTVAKVGGTSYTLNWLPLGGFVKIYGEDGDGAGPNSFSKRPRILQALVLVAGIAMNLFFAYVLITGALIAGTPRALAPEELARAKNVELAVVNVLPNTPAARAGIQPGDMIISATDAVGQWRASDPESFSTFVDSSKGVAIILDLQHNGQEQSIIATPAAGVASSDPRRYALGVEVGTVGVVPLSFGTAIIEGASLTWGATELTAEGLWQFFFGIFTLHPDFSQVAGPIGIAVAGGAEVKQGLSNIFIFVAEISISLALVNLLPIPALDGGRLLIVIIESVTRRPLKVKKEIINAITEVCFILLIILMFVVSAHDISKVVW